MPAPVPKVRCVLIVAAFVGVGAGALVSIQDADRSAATEPTVRDAPPRTTKRLTSPEFTAVGHIARARRCTATILADDRARRYLSLRCGDVPGSGPVGLWISADRGTSKHEGYVLRESNDSIHAMLPLSEAPHRFAAVLKVQHRGESQTLATASVDAKGVTLRRDEGS